MNCDTHEVHSTKIEKAVYYRGERSSGSVEYISYRRFCGMFLTCAVGVSNLRILKLYTRNSFSFCLISFYVVVFFSSCARVPTIFRGKNRESRDVYAFNCCTNAPLCVDQPGEEFKRVQEGL